MKVLVAGYDQEQTRRVSQALREGGHQVLGAVGRHGARTFVKVVTLDAVLVPAGERAARVRGWLEGIAEALLWVELDAGADAACALVEAAAAGGDATEAGAPYIPKVPAPAAETGGGLVPEGSAARADEADPAAPTGSVAPRASSDDRGLMATAPSGRPPSMTAVAAPAAVAEVAPPAGRGGRPIETSTDAGRGGRPLRASTDVAPGVPSRRAPLARLEPAQRPAAEALPVASGAREPAAEVDEELRAKLAQARFGDYHSILEVEPDASPYAVRAQYKRLDRLYSFKGWPRRLGPQDLETLQEIRSALRDAYLIISDPELRARYERALLGAPGSRR